MIKKILILATNPDDTSRLRLDKEVREIEEGLTLAKQREKFAIKAKWAVRYKDLRRVLLEHEPQIVHFAGHGEASGLMMEGDLEIAEIIPSKVLAGLFKLCARHVECVILNACYSTTQAAAINKHIRYVIGMPGKIKDKAAIEFAVGFYDALGAGKNVEEAFKFGCNASQLVNSSKKFLPRLFKSKTAHNPQEVKNDIGTENTGPPASAATQPAETKQQASQIIHFDHAENVDITNSGDIINYPTGKKKAKKK